MSLLALLLAAPLLARATGVPAQEPVSAPELLTPARRWALVVGAGQYEHLGTLRYAAADAHLFADALVEKLAFERDTIRLLTDDAREPELRPTAGHLLGELEALLKDKRRTRSDLFVFYFCGHGVGLSEGDLLLPTDARRETAARVGLPVREVVERLSGAGMRNVLVVVDACRTGAENPFGAELWQLAERARLALVLGCEPGGQSYEDAFLGHGLFTQALVDALGERTLFDRAGGLWASRLAQSAREQVRSASARHDPPQTPAVWSDPTQDVLLALAPGAVQLEAFREVAAGLAPEARLDAYRACAGELFFAERYLECLEFLRPLEQLGPLTPDLGLMQGAALQVLGRSLESARAFQAVRQAAPDSFEAAQATLFDQGLASASERAEAAELLWTQGPPMPFSMLLLALDALETGGLTESAGEVARSALAQAPEGSRDQAYLHAIFQGKEGALEEALLELAHAEELPGDYPTTARLRELRVRLTYSLSGIEAARALLDETIALAPEEGAWYAWRAWLGRNAANGLGELPAVRADVRAALQRTLDPEYLFMATRAAGMDALTQAEAIASQAARHPLSWQAQIAATFVAPGEDKRESVAAVARLAARPALVYSAFASLMLDATLEDADRVVSERGGEAGLSEAVGHQVSQQYLQVIERLVPMAGDFGQDQDAWDFLVQLHDGLDLCEPLARLFERHLGPLADAGRLSESLLASFLPVALDAGREERADQLLARIGQTGPTADAMHRLAGIAAALRGDEELALRRLAGRDIARDPEHKELGRAVEAWFAARAGDGETARARLDQGPFESPLALVLALHAAHVLGDKERLVPLALAAGALPRKAAFFARASVARLADDARQGALAAALASPGNPLVAELGFARGLAAFEGVQEFDLDVAPEVLEAEDGTLTLTVKSGGRVLGTLELSTGEIVPLTGTLDEFGNLTATLRPPEGAQAVLAKLAPPGFGRVYEPWASQGQYFHLLDADGVVRVWHGLAKE